METLYIFLACLPTAIVSFGMWFIQWRIQKAEKRREKQEEERRKEEKEREKLREQQELFLINGVTAAIALGEATAKAVQRIPDAHCNGDMHAALDYADKVKHAHRDFLAKNSVHFLYD